MPFSVKYIERELFEVMPETCPAIDEALSDAARVIKSKTEKFREVLREYLTRALEAEKDLDDAKDRIVELEDLVSELKDEIFVLQCELDSSRD